MSGGLYPVKDSIDFASALYFNDNTIKVHCCGDINLIPVKMYPFNFNLIYEFKLTDLPIASGTKSDLDVRIHKALEEKGINPRVYKR